MPTQPRIVEIECAAVRRELVNYTEDDLTPDLLARIDEHLSRCRHCKAIFDGARNIVRLLGDDSVFALPDGFSQRLRQRFAFQNSAADRS